MQGYSFGETLSIVGCIVMIIGLVGVVFPGLSRWWNKDYGNE